MMTWNGRRISFLRLQLRLCFQLCRGLTRKVMDYWKTYRSIVKNAPKLGFHEVYKACCGSSGGPYNFDFSGTCGSDSASSCQNPSQYINWDGVHLTEAMYKVVSELFLNGAFTYPPFKSLLRSKQNSA